jgi:hypothetical protein
MLRAPAGRGPSWGLREGFREKLPVATKKCDALEGFCPRTARLGILGGAAVKPLPNS